LLDQIALDIRALDIQALVELASADIDGAFERFWKTMPARDGSNPKKPAKLRYARIIGKRFATFEELQHGAERYAEAQRGRDPKFVCQVVTWLNQERWKDQDWNRRAKPSSLFDLRG
jgi:hypothetical protein